MFASKNNLVISTTISKEFSFPIPSPLLVCGAPRYSFGDNYLSSFISFNKIEQFFTEIVFAVFTFRFLDIVHFRTQTVGSNSVHSRQRTAYDLVSFSSPYSCTIIGESESNGFEYLSPRSQSGNNDQLPPIPANYLRYDTVANTKSSSAIFPARAPRS